MKMVDSAGPVVAISTEFLTAFAAVPKKMQGKVLSFITKFRANPTAPGINYEKIKQFRDQSLRSVRIDQSYRGIVKQPESGNVYMLLWVDHHDKAYDWAKNKKCSINPETGSIQVYDVDEMQMPGEGGLSPAAEGNGGGLFASVHRRHLLKLGVPEDLIPVVRAIETEEQLDQALDRIPVEAHCALTALAADYQLDEVLRMCAETTELAPEVDTEDFQTALASPGTRSRFVVVEDDIALREILAAPLEKWRVFLHPSQRSLVERDWNGPVRVLGGAGTGKTVVAIHRARYLAEKIFTAGRDRILFTTYTRNLAADIEENLSKICPEQVLRRIEVVNLDHWVSSYLKRNNYPCDIDYGKRTEPLWDMALALAPGELGLEHSFYREEWERVVQAQSITTFAEYRDASRIGRGIRLNRQKRMAVWPVFDEYRRLLEDHGLREVEDAMRDACALIRKNRDALPYRAVIVDEAQDMGHQAFMLIREIAGKEHKNDLFIVGDAHQRIYRHQVVLRRCGINIIGRGRKLRLNYRTTEENRRWAVNLLKGLSFDDLDGGIDDQSGYRSLLHGVEPKVVHLPSFEAEIDYVIEYIGLSGNNGGDLHEICLVARTNDLLRRYEKALRAKGFDTYLIRRSRAEERTHGGIRLATMHRVKGLEFNRIIIAGVNDDVMPLTAAPRFSSDKAILRQNEIQEKSLLYVSVTRAKQEVLITSSGRPSRFLKP